MWNDRYEDVPEMKSCEKCARLSVQIDALWERIERLTAQRDEAEKKLKDK